MKVLRWTILFVIVVIASMVVSQSDSGLRCNIQRISYNALEKISKFDDFPTKPVIYTGHPSRQQKMISVGNFDNLHDVHGNIMVHLSSSNTYSHGKHTMLLSQYLDYIKESLQLQNQRANETLYLFGNNYQGVFQQLSDEYVIPPCSFCQQAGAVTVGIGGAHSGVSFHFHGPGFSESIIGPKRWFLYPPFMTKVVEKFGVNTTVAAWVEHFYPLLDSTGATVNNSGELFSTTPNGFTVQEWDDLSKHLSECIINPGELLYFPAQWMHATLNLGAYNVFVSLFLDTQLIK